MLKRILSVALILLSYSAYSQTSTKVWSLAEAVEYAIEQNLQIQNAQLNVESAEIGFSQAKANLLPNLTTGASVVCAMADLLTLPPTCLLTQE
jgi:outer membrane protein